MVPRSLLSEDDLSGSSSAKLIILVKDRRWHFSALHPERLACQTFTATQRALGPARLSLPPEFIFSDDRSVKKLNARFRNKNKPTNVLTFEPSYPGDGGSIILAFETMQRESQEAGHSLKAHSAHLIVHGLLHLAGHDHFHPGEARAMELCESWILHQMGFTDPWKRGKRFIS